MEAYKTSQTSLLYMKKLDNKASNFLSFVCSLFQKVTF